MKSSHHSILRYRVHKLIVTKTPIHTQTEHINTHIQKLANLIAQKFFLLSSGIKNRKLTYQESPSANFTTFLNLNRVGVFDSTYDVTNSLNQYSYDSNDNECLYIQYYDHRYNTHVAKDNLKVNKSGVPFRKFKLTAGLLSFAYIDAESASFQTKYKHE